MPACCTCACLDVPIHLTNRHIEQLADMFPNEQAAAEWFEQLRWPDERICVKCGGLDTYRTKNAKPQPFRCRDCKQGFSVKTGTVMAHSNLPGDTKLVTLQRFVRRYAKAGSTLYSDEAPAYDGMPEYKHRSVNHSKGQYVDGDAHTNGIESMWAPIKRGYKGTFHWMSRTHLHRYVTEFVAHNNARRLATVDHMALLVLGGEGKRLPWKELTK